MFNLKTCVHLHEEELISCRVKDKFNCSRVHISDCSCCLYCSFTYLRSNFLSKLRRCFFNNLLMASLHRAVSLIKIDVVTMTITKNLKFNMSWLCDILFNNDVLIIEALKCLSFCCIKLIVKFFFILNNTHSLATTSK